VSDSGDKPFDAPPSRIAKAKREGNVPRAQELGANLAFVAAALATAAIAQPLGSLAMRALRQATASHAPVSLIAGIVLLSLAPLVSAAVAGAVGSVAQSGGLVVSGVSLKCERMNAVEGIRRMFSRESATHVARAICACAVASLVMLPALRDLVSASSTAVLPLSLARVAWNGALRATFAAIAVGMVFAFAEYAVARRQWLRKLRMSFAEFKRELKESDGDPLARSRRRSLHRSLVRGPVSKVKDASFVVVNPTHVAVALEYRPPAVAIPTVLVRAAGEMALRVRELAADYRVPIVESAVLARALYATCRIAQPIGHEHYVAVAEIVAALYRSGALSS
jgi:flagellar biosynthesis protein FlhB